MDAALDELAPEGVAAGAGELKPDGLVGRRISRGLSARHRPPVIQSASLTNAAVRRKRWPAFEPTTAGACLAGLRSAATRIATHAHGVRSGYYAPAFQASNTEFGVSVTPSMADTVPVVRAVKRSSARSYISAGKGT